MKSVINDEVRKFSLLANKWWDLDGELKVLHEFNTPRLQFVLHHLSGNKFFTKNTLMLDVGCGGGILTESLATYDFNLTAIDASNEIIQIAKEHAVIKGLEKNIHYQVASAESWLEKGYQNYYDVIYALEIIEHVPNPHIFIKTLSSLLKSGGIIFLSTINRTLASLILAKFTSEYILNWLPKGTHNFNKFIKIKEMHYLMEKNFLKIKEIKGIKYNLPKKKWCLSQDSNINYILVAQKN